MMHWLYKDMHEMATKLEKHIKMSDMKKVVLQ